jgi:uncharacterized DUF497 family protein
MLFLWSSRNIEHIAKHGVTLEEGGYVVNNAKPPFPESVGDHKKSVWGRTRAGRYLQVIFVYAEIEDVEVDEYAQLAPHERLALEDGETAVRIIHARDLTKDEMRRLRRRK